MKKQLKLSVIIFLGLILNISTFAQHDLENNFYMLNPFVFNPAATGSEGNASGFFNYRDKWTGFENSPKHMQFGIHAMASDAVGLGLMISQQEFGVLKEFSASLNYSYRLKLSKDESLAFGLSFGIKQNSLDFNKMNIEDPSDAILYSDWVNKTYYNAGIGIHYNREALNVHVSVPLLYDSMKEKIFQNMLTFISYDIILENDDWMIQPSVLHRYDEGEFHNVDLNMLVEWKRQLWVQSSYRTKGSIVLALGIKFENVGIAYSYEMITSKLSTAASATHEIVLFIDSPLSLTKKSPHYRKTKKSYWQ